MLIFYFFLSWTFECLMLSLFFVCLFVCLLVYNDFYHLLSVLSQKKTIHTLALTWTYRTQRKRTGTFFTPSNNMQIQIVTFGKWRNENKTKHRNYTHLQLRIRYLFCPIHKFYLWIETNWKVYGSFFLFPFCATSIVTAS